MIYIDTSVVLAHVLSEDVRPPITLWNHPLASSQLTEYEAWVRVHAYGKAATHGATLASTLGTLDLLALDEAACSRCRAPFPLPVRTLDALHLAAADHLRSRGFEVEVASYDERMRAAAAAMGFQIYPL